MGFLDYNTEYSGGKRAYRPYFHSDGSIKLFVDYYADRPNKYESRVNVRLHYRVERYGDYNFLLQLKAVLAWQEKWANLITITGDGKGALHEGDLYYSFDTDEDSAIVTLYGVCDAPKHGWTCHNNDWDNGYKRGKDFRIYFPGKETLVPPKPPTTQLVNGSRNVTITERTQNLHLTWNQGVSGSYPIHHYKIYYSVGKGWKFIREVDANVYSTDVRVSDIYPALSRGQTIGFQVTSQANVESSAAYGHTDNNKVTLAYSTVSMYTSEITPVQARIHWQSNVVVSKVEWKRSSDSNWRYVTGDANATSGSFIAGGLTYNTSQVIQVRITTRSDGFVTSSSVNLTTKDIARITKLPLEWNIEQPLTMTINNPGHCTMNLYLTYNGIEIISRTKITLNSQGQYTLNLSDSERYNLYKYSVSDAAVTFGFIIKSYISNKIGEDHPKYLKAIFPAKAWVKVNTNWKRAIVWVKALNVWKKCVPWVKINQTWKRV